MPLPGVMKLIGLAAVLRVLNGKRLREKDLHRLMVLMALTMAPVVLLLLERATPAVSTGRAGLQLLYRQTARNIRVLGRCRALKKYAPTPWMLALTGHIQTLWGLMVRRYPGLQGLLFNTPLEYDRELVPVSKGGVIALDWYKPDFDVSQDPPPPPRAAGAAGDEARGQSSGSSAGREAEAGAGSGPPTSSQAEAPSLRNSASAPCLADPLPKHTGGGGGGEEGEAGANASPSPAQARRALAATAGYSASAPVGQAEAESAADRVRRWHQLLPASQRPLSPTARPVLIILHGLTGGSQEVYIQATTAEAAEHGMRPVVMIARGCGGLALTSPMCFSAALTDDVRAAVRRVRQRVGEDTPLFAIGFSLGASILAKYLCEEGAEAPLVAAASCAASFDPRLSCSALEENSLYRMTYNRSMAHSLKTFYERHRDQFEKGEWHRGPEHHEEIMRASTVREFDAAATASMHGFRSFVEYYDEATTSHRIAREIKVPYLILNAKDDPVCHAGGVPVEAALHNKNVVIGITEEGGHVAWCQGWLALGRYWAEQAAVEFFLSHLQERHADEAVKHDLELAAKRMVEGGGDRGVRDGVEVEEEDRVGDSAGAVGSRGGLGPGTASGNLALWGQQLLAGARAAVR